MIDPDANVAQAKYSFRMLKFNAIALALVWPLEFLLAYVLPSSALNSSWLPVAYMTTFFTCYVLTAYWIATLAKDLSKQFPAWFVGSMVFGPIGIIVAFVRVRNLAKVYGIV